MTEPRADEISPHRLRMNSQKTMLRFIWGLLKPFLLVAGGVAALLYLLRFAGV